MTSKSSRIAVPFGQQLRRARYRLLPLLIFGLAVAGTIFLWGRQNATPNAVGAVDAVRYDVTSEIDGWLVWDDANTIELFETVVAGQPVARLDERPTLHLLASLKAELAAARMEVVAAEADAKLDDTIRIQDRVVESRRLALDIESIRLTVLDHKTELESERIHLQRRSEQVEVAKKLLERGAATELEFLETKLERDVVAEHIKGLESLVAEAESQFKAAQERAKGLPEAARADLDAITAPLREAAAVKEALVKELEARVKALVIRAPSAGQVTAIWRRPGQSVRRGEFIVTIADPTARRIVSYLRADQRIDPKPGMTVVVRSRIDPSKAHRAQVSEVGTQFELIPLQHLRNPAFPEWGLPVGIELPAGSLLRPGEIVDLAVRR